MGEVTSQPIPGHKPQPPAGKGGKRATPRPSNPPPNPQPTPKHTHTKPQPDQARNKRSPHPLAQTASPGQDRKRAGGKQNPSTCRTPLPHQEKPGEEEPRTQAGRPHNSRKPSVHRSDTEPALAMQVTRPNQVRSPGPRLHPKASAAVGLEAERATAKHLGTQVRGLMNP